MSRTVVGLFDSVPAAQRAVAQLRAAGFAAAGLHLATSATLRAQHLPAAGAPAPENLEDGLTRFFSDLFTGPAQPDAPATRAALHPDGAVLTVAAPEAAAGHARRILAACGALDVYQQAAPPAPGAPAPAPDELAGLTAGLGRLRDDEELDANGLTTH